MDLIVNLVHHSHYYFGLSTIDLSLESSRTSSPILRLQATTQHHTPGRLVYVHGVPFQLDFLTFQNTGLQDYLMI